MYLDLTNEKEIQYIILTLKINKSESSDGIRAVDLKSEASRLSTIITKLINCSLNEEQYHIF